MRPLTRMLRDRRSIFFFIPRQATFGLTILHIVRHEASHANMLENRSVWTRQSFALLYHF